MPRRMVTHWRGGQPVRSYFEAARPDPQRKQRKESGSGDSAILRAGTSLREQARHLDQNHDIARGALNTLVQNVVGANGIGVEPQPRTNDGKIHDDFSWQIQQLLEDWGQRPEVTHQHDWAASQRLACRTWLRDGEVLAQQLSGNIATLDHGTRVPYSLELIEPDFLPLDYNSRDPHIVAGIELNGWGRPRTYHVYRSHPGDFLWTPKGTDLKPIPAGRILHLKHVDRIGQMRGVSIFASVLLRLDDVKDYEESERIAAKIAASMAAYIKKGTPDAYEAEVDENGDPFVRDMRFRPGMIFDDLEPGEEIGTIDTQRPSAQLEPHRNGQLRAAASGMYLTYSSLSKDYSGNYSSQRQELVEGFGAYGMLGSEFIGQFVRPNYHRVLEMALLSGQLVVPKDIDPFSLGDALYIPPQMPWIDPLKEAKAWATLEEHSYASGPEIIRRRGQNPRDVIDQQESWVTKKSDRGLTGNEDAINSNPKGNTNAKAIKSVS